MKKRDSNPSEIEHEKLFLNIHLSDVGILLSLDGELTAKEAAEVDAHFQACWSCRSRRQVIADSIADLVDYQNAMTAPYLPPPMDLRAIFVARLDALAVEMGRPSPLINWFNEAIRLMGFGQVNQLARIAGVLVLITSGVFFYFLRPSNVVSADELLTLTADSEVKLQKIAVEPVVVQKVRISVGEKAFTRTVYRDVVHNRVTSRTEASGTADAQVKAAYLKSSLDWDSPLDAETYRRWQKARPESHDRVIRLGKDQLILQTTSAAGPVTEADLTVRIADYHAVKESFRFEDNSEVEIAELSYDVLPFASVPMGIFGMPIQAAVIRIPATAALRSPLPGRTELAEAEVEAEVRLHGLGADLGEQINITPRVGNGVLIEGVVGDDARKQELLFALQNIPNTKLHILTVDEAAQQAPSSPVVTHVQPALTSVRVMVASPPLLDAQLNLRFPDKDQRIAYVNQTLSLAQLASARAWALNRLADRHPSREVAILNDDARRRLQVLLTDHVSALREDVSSLQNQVAEVLSRSSNTPAANTSVKAPLESNSTNAPESSEDWRDRIRRIHSSTEAVHEAVAALLSSSQSGDQSDANAIEIDLRTSLTQLQTELQTLDQKVHETDLK